MEIRFCGKTYALDEAHFAAVFNDETKPMKEVAPEAWLALLQPAIEDTLDLEYYEDPCENCPPKERAKKELIPFVEGHFYVFTKQGLPVMTTLDPAFEGLSYDKLLGEGKVDDSYICSVVICPDCGEFQLIIEQVEM